MGNSNAAPEHPTAGRNRQIWSKEELQSLRTYYPIEGAQGVHERLGGARGFAAIRNKTAKLGLTSPWRWSPTEQQELLRMAASSRSPEYIAAKLRRTVSSVVKMHSKLTLRKELMRRQEMSAAQAPATADDSRKTQLLDSIAPLNVPGRRKVNRYTVARITRDMENAGSEYLGGDVTGPSSLVEGRCPCGETVSKRAEDWYRTPGGCGHCRGASNQRTRSGERLELARALAEGRGGICAQAGPKDKNSKVLWFCSQSHTWEATLNSVEGGTWCPHCRTLRTEQMVRSFLEQALAATFAKVRPDWLGGLELDGYNPEMELAFEYQGQWHETEKQKKRDARKRAICRDVGVRLIEVWHTDARLGVDSVRQAVARELKRLGISPVHPLESILPEIVPEGVQLDHKVAFEAEIARQGWTCDPSTWLGVDEKVMVNPHDGGALVAALPRTVIKGMKPGRLANTAVLSDEERHQRLNASGWNWIKDAPYSNAHQKLTLIDPSGRVRNLTWNKWASRHERRTGGR